MKENKLKLARAKKQVAQKKHNQAKELIDSKQKEQELLAYLKGSKQYIDGLIEGLKVILDDQTAKSYEQLGKLTEELHEVSSSERQGLTKEITELTKTLAEGLTVSNIKEAKSTFEAKEYKLELPKWMESNNDFVEIKDALAKLVTKASDPVVQITPESQKAPDFMPFRRVVKDGRGLRFDDTPSGFMGGGGDSSGGVGLTDAELRASDVAVAEATKEGLTPYAEQLTSSASITPANGKKIEVVWVQVIADPDGSAGNLVTIGFNGGTTLYKVYALGRSAVFTGDTDQVLDITLENSQPVTVNIQYREVV